MNYAEEMSKRGWAFDQSEYEKNTHSIYLFEKVRHVLGCSSLHLPESEWEQAFFRLVLMNFPPSGAPWS